MNKFLEETTTFVKKGCNQAGELAGRAMNAAPDALKSVIDGAKKNKEAVILTAAAVTTGLVIKKLCKKSKKK
jgi:hypothetical protein